MASIDYDLDLAERASALELIVNSAPALIHTALADGYIDFFNQTWLDYVGLPLDELEGWKWTAAIHPDDLAGILAKWRASLRSGEPFLHECRVRRADGEYRWMLHHKVAVRDEHGNIGKWHGSSIDIEDRKRAEIGLHSALDEVKRLKDQLHKENIVLREEIVQASMFDEVIGSSPALSAVLRRVRKVAPTDSTVLITGETGTGKELIARAIHQGSKRRGRPFVTVNCAALPPSLIAAELFGHEKGAFTGAAQRRLGRFELADGGTIFLDEIGDIAAETQVTLLRVLQEHDVERVGGSRPIRVDVRVIVATNRDLQAAMTAGTFRSDLFYRLNVFPIAIPPLRERTEDIPLLAEYFVERYAKRLGRDIKNISKKTLASLQSYPWPGNIRELQNVVERSLIIGESETFTVDESWLAYQPAETGARGQALPQRLATDEKAAIEAALAETRGRISGPSGAATKLGIPASTLESKIRMLKINKHRFKTPR